MYKANFKYYFGLDSLKKFPTDTIDIETQPNFEHNKQMIFTDIKLDIDVILDIDKILDKEIILDINIILDMDIILDIDRLLDIERI